MTSTSNFICSTSATTFVFTFPEGRRDAVADIEVTPFFLLLHTHTLLTSPNLTGDLSAIQETTKERSRKTFSKHNYVITEGLGGFP